jgi:hypothetical protein
VTTAETDYFAYDDVMWRGRGRLCFSRDPLERAALLETEAEGCEHRARLEVPTFGDDTERYDGDISPARWQAYSARLLRIVANAERCRATGVWVPCDDELEDPVAEWLHRFAVGYPRHRALRGACEVWVELVGGQAVETIATLPDGRRWLCWPKPMRLWFR